MPATNRMLLTIMATLAAVLCNSAQAQSAGKKFEIVEATIADIQNAIMAKQLTATELVHMYLARIKAYNGTCVEEPQGILGPVSPIPHAGAVNALITLNLRPTARTTWEFDERKARSMTDDLDNDSAMPDALEVAAALDAQFARTGQLAGPLHGVVLSIKDMIDTFDMRTASGADADYANDRPPRDATLVKRLRDAGAIVLAKANLGEYASGSRSAFGGTICNPYDTARDPGGSSGGSAASVAANLVTCAISEEGGPSIRMPSRLNNGVGLSQSQGLVSRDGMIGGGGLNDRNGAACRTVEDVGACSTSLPAMTRPTISRSTASAGFRGRAMRASRRKLASTESGSESSANSWTSGCSRRPITSRSTSSTRRSRTSASLAPRSSIRDQKARCFRTASTGTFPET